MPYFRFPPKLGGIAGATSGVDGAVLTSAQTLSVGQQAQAQTNIGVAEVKLVIAADTAMVNNTLAVIVSATLAAGIWSIEGYIPFTVSAGTPGIKIEILPGGTITAGSAMVEIYNTNAIIGTPAIPIATGGYTIVHGGNTGAPVAGYHNCIRLRGFVNKSTSSTAQLLLAQNTTSNTTTALAGGWVTFRKMN